MWSDEDSDLAYSFVACFCVDRWEKRSGEEFGPDGYWKRWTQLSGSSADGTVRAGGGEDELERGWREGEGWGGEGEERKVMKENSRR